MGFSQQEMAEKVNMTQSTYSRKEKGTTPIYSEEWERIAKALQVKKEEIFEENNQLTFKYKNNRGGYNGYCVIADQSEQVIAQYEKHLEEKEKEIEFLRGLLQEKNA